MIFGISKIIKNRNIQLHFFLLSILFLAYLIFTSNEFLFFGGILTTSIYFYIGLKEAKKDEIFFNPISFYFFWYSINLGLSAIYIYTILESRGYISFSTAQLYSEKIALGYFIFHWGSFFLHLGLQLNHPFFSKKHFTKKVFITKNSFLTLFIISIIYQFTYPYLSFLGGFISFMNFSMFTVMLILALNPNNFLNVSTIKQRNLLLIGSICLFILNSRTTSKAYMMLSFFPIIWYLIYRKKLTMINITLLSLVLSLLYFSIIFPLSYELRENYLVTKNLDIISSILKVVEGKSKYLDFKSQDRHPFYSFLSRSFDPIAVSYISEQVERYGFRYGQTMQYVFYGLIPRILWQNKPTITQGSWFAYYLSFAPSPEKSSVSIGITAIGELYWNFGLIGVAVGMFMIGIGVSGLWRLVGLYPQFSNLSMLLYVNILFNMPNMSEAGTTLISIITLLIVFNVFYYIRDTLIKFR